MQPGDDEPADDAADEGKVLSPEELDISDDDHVEQLDEGRYVVSPDVREGPSTHAASDPAATPSDGQPAGEDVGFSDAAVHDWLREELADTNARYGFDVTAKFDGRVSQQRMMSNDIVTVFESLMLWYARQVDGETPVEEVIGILLSESNVPVRYPPGSLRTLVEGTDCTPEDSIADLLAAVADSDSDKF